MGPSQSKKDNSQLGHFDTGEAKKKAGLFAPLTSLFGGGGASKKKKKHAHQQQQQQQNAQQANAQAPLLEPMTLTASKNLTPRDFAEIATTYSVDWSDAGKLGAGHYATVYKGTHLKYGQTVAVKRVSKTLTRAETLKIEVEALRTVAGHANIVQLYDVYLDDKYMYLVLEYLGGGELFTRIVNSGAYSERDACRHMRKIGEALKWMHDLGIVHRDLKPENLVLANENPDSDIKISDFGLSKILLDDDMTIMTVCGTKAYSAPEVGFGMPRGTQKGYSNKVDMWSLGVIIYVIVAAYHPFDPFGTSSDQEIWNRICRVQWDFKDPVWAAVSASLKDVLTKLICKNPEQRLSADDFLAHEWVKLEDAAPSAPIPFSRQRSSRYWNVGAMPLPPSPPFDGSTPPNGGVPARESEQDRNLV